MVYLNTNTAAQTLRLSLDEARQYYSTAFTDYLLLIYHEENSNVGNSIAQVPPIVVENQRYTELTVTTIGLTLPGRYRYDVYGQNSNSNTDPNDASVVGLCERGYLYLNDSGVYFEVPTITIQDDIIYNG
ncbi:hypothetical protein EB118_21405 [bacterium]|jgi:hypothetical protein|nr:hypothetical protein [bacterium]